MAQQTANAAPLTVVLVHGACADASSWNGVIERLQAAGLQVTAPSNPLRGISIDSAYTASFLKQIPGPVLAVGHSYGGEHPATHAMSGTVTQVADPRRLPRGRPRSLLAARCREAPAGSAHQVKGLDRRGPR
jgi:pimeloyl-ACP methyl ester carboxylesterase